MAVFFLVLKLWGRGGIWEKDGDELTGRRPNDCGVGMGGGRVDWAVTRLLTTYLQLIFSFHRTQRIKPEVLD